MRLAFALLLAHELVGQRARAQTPEPLLCGVAIQHRLEVGATHAFMLSGEPGGRFNVDVADVSGTVGLIRLRAVGGSDSCAGSLSVQIPPTGQLQIEVSDCDLRHAGDYTVVAQGISEGAGNCTRQPACGVAPSALQIAGEVDAFSVSGSAGAQLVLTTPDRTSTSLLRMRLFDPAGQEVTAGSINCGGSLRATLNQTGEYTVLVSSCSQPARTGAYTLTGDGAACPPGPVVTYFGFARADDQALMPDTFDAMNRPVYVRPVGQGFSLVLEARPGPNARPPGLRGFVNEPGDPTALPDAQLLASRPLGFATTAICDNFPPNLGGIPATARLEFAPTAMVANAVNDFGCRINDGQSGTMGRATPDEACTRRPVTQDFAFVNDDSTVQFCAPIALDWAFATGDTIVKARVRATDGALGAAREIVVRVQDQSPYFLRAIDPQETAVVGPYLYFSAADNERGTELWRSNGTREGTDIVRDLIPGSRGSSPRGLNAIDDRLYFIADSATSQSMLWRAFSDSSFAAPLITRNVGNALPGPWALTNVAGRLFFFVESGNDLALWRSDGTEVGTEVVWPFSSPVGMVDNPTAVGGTFFFTAYDAAAAPRAFTLWKSDGTQEGSALVRRFEFPGSDRAHFGELTDVAGTLYFVAGGGGNRGLALWRSDGTEDGTLELKRFVSPAGGSGPGELTAIDDTLIFAADDGATGVELWKSDGTIEGTVLVRDINRGPASSNPHALTRANERLFFAADDGISGTELWRSNGNSDGTIRVMDINPGPAGSDPSGLTDVNGFVFFSASDGLSGTELWQSDGTELGTLMPLDLAPGDASSRPDAYVPVLTGDNAPALFLRTLHAATGAGLWNVPYPRTRPPIASCTGDCDGNMMVTVNELVTGVGIALGGTSLDRCVAFDSNSDGQVMIDELVSGVRGLLDGCL